MIRRTAVVTAALFILTGPALALRVAVEAANTSALRGYYGSPPSNAVYEIQNLCVAQGWTATIVDGSQVNTVEKLNNYDVLVTGDAGYNDDDHALFETALRDWVTAGGGFVGLGWLVYSTNPGTAMEQTMAVRGGNYGFRTNGNLQVTVSHPITDGVAAFPIQAFGEFPGNGLYTGGVQLGDYSSATGAVSIAYRNVGTGRSVYLGPCYFATFSGYPGVRNYYSDVNARRLLKQAIEWAAGIRPDAECVSIDVPSGNVNLGETIQPKATVKNSGTAAAAFDVRFTIDDGTDYTSTRTTGTLEPDQTEQLTFADWTPGSLGSFAMKCSTELTDDAENSNDKKTGSVFVQYVDAGVLSLTSPSGMYTPGQSVSPVATWRNHGNQAASFEAWMIMNDPTDAEKYRQKVDLVGIAPGGNIQVSSFPAYTVTTPGIWTVRCSTGLTGDVNPDNDVLDDDFLVGSPDMRALAILAPSGRVDTSAVVAPSATVKNEGTVNVPFRVWFIMNSPDDGEEYREHLDITGIAPGGTQTYSFPDHNVGTTEGAWTTRCSVYVASDQNTVNDFVDGGFTVAAPMPWLPGWHEAKALPSPPSNKPIKDGGWLAVGPDKESGIGIRGSGSGHPTTWSPDHLVTSSVIYAAKGNKATDFFKYYPLEDTWLKLGDIPETEDGKRKPPSKGTDAVSDGEGVVYMTRGNNMLGFWKYVVAEDSWKRAEEDVPLGDYKKKVKGGNDMVYAFHNDTGYVYLLKGQKTEFYRFNTTSGKWQTRDEVPYQVKQKYDKGSFLAYDGENTIYAHQAKVNDGTNHYMFAFDLVSQTWNTVAKKGIPLYAKEGDKTKKKKVADGAAGAWSGSNLYAFKGGNTQSFFKYAVAQDTWTELANIPELGSTEKKKRIKAGGDLVAFGGAFFAFKGNKTLEFWRYVEPTTPPMATRPDRDGVAAGVIGNGEWRMGIAPNPLSSGFATLRYSLPRPGTATVTVFDVAGRSVFSTRSPGHLTTGSLPLDLRSLSGGVYLVKLEADNFTQTQKLVVQK